MSLKDEQVLQGSIVVSGDKLVAKKQFEQVCAPTRSRM
jgi:hypothetical protein